MLRRRPFTGQTAMLRSNPAAGLSRRPASTGTHTPLAVPAALPADATPSKSYDFVAGMVDGAKRAETMAAKQPVGSPASVAAELQWQRQVRQDRSVPSMKRMYPDASTPGGAEAVHASSSAAHSSRVLWFDDEASKREKKRTYESSAVYRELHRSHLSNADCGLFGGEAGFEKSPRMWVDPDNPHVETIWTDSPLAGNRKYARYGHFKRELQIVDFDKLTRHARAVPQPDKLLHDAVASRTSLNDHNASAIIMHGFRCMMGMSRAAKQSYFGMVEETFERMLVTAIPAVDVGPKTHAAMIRVCAAAHRFEEGYNWYFKRAVEEANDELTAQAHRKAKQQQSEEAGGSDFYFVDSSDAPFELTADVFDAALMLCNETGHHAQALEVLDMAVRGGRRLHRSTLDYALFACAHLRFGPEAESVWQLYALYDREPNAASFEALAACAARCAAAGDSTGIATRLASVLDDANRVLQKQLPEVVHGSQLMKTPNVVSADTYGWVIHGFALNPVLGHQHGDTILDLMHALEGQAGLCDTHVVTLALQYCSLHPEDGAATALRVWQDFVVKPDATANFEMLVLFARSIAFAEREPHPTDLRLLKDAIHVSEERLNTQTARHTRFNEKQLAVSGEFEMLPDAKRGDGVAPASDQLVGRERAAKLALDAAMLVMAARLGAAAESMSIVSRVVTDLQNSDSDELVVPGFLFTQALLANAKAKRPVGSHRMTNEILDLVRAIRGFEITEDFVAALCACRRSHGKVPEKSALFRSLCAFGIPEAEVTMLELMDAHDLQSADALRARKPDGVEADKARLRGDLLAFAVDDESESTLRAVCSPVLSELRTDADTDAYHVAVQPHTLDPASLRPRVTGMHIDAARFHVRPLGESAPMRAKIRFEKKEKALARFFPLNGSVANGTKVTV